MIKKLIKRVKKSIKNFTPRQKKLWAVLKFLMIFNILAIPLHFVIYFNINLYTLAYLERAQVSFILNIFGIKHLLYDIPYQSGVIPAIDLNQQVLAIGEPCTAFRSILAFTALVIATPKSWKLKKKALILFLPVIYIANIARITTLAFVTISLPSILELVHIILWREGMILLIIGLWIYWFNNMNEEEIIDYTE